MRNRMKRWTAGWRGVLALVAVAMLVPVAGSARAQDQQDQDEDYGATYARIRYLEGQVTVQRTGEAEVVEASLNDPLVPGDRIWTDSGRAEIALADGSILRLDASTHLIVRSLADMDNRYEKTDLIALQDGSIQVQVPEPSSQDAVFQIDSDAGSVYLLSGGSFRVDAEGGMTTVSSFRGAAELSGDTGSVLVRSGERSSVQRARSPADPRAFNTLRQDDFDRFCENRGEAYLQPAEEQPPEGVVEDIPEPVRPYYHELTFYGGWHQLPSYGWVWRPVYQGSWGPYVNGYWTWCPTGWVWVSYDPWGWAPYHYGRWDFTVDLGWFWIPGGVWGGGWVSFAVGSSYLGWCPLNYYNLPVFEGPTFVNVVNVNVGRLNGRAWSFVPLGRFGVRRGEHSVVRVNRLPRGTDLVVTGRLPRFYPREVAGNPDRGARFVDTVRGRRTPLPVVEGRAGRPESFRTVESRTHPRGERGTARPRVAPPAGRRPGTSAPPRTGGPAPRGQANEPHRGTPRDRGMQPAPPRSRPPERATPPRGSKPRPSREEGDTPRQNDSRRSGAARAGTVEGRGTQARAQSGAREPARGHAVETLVEGARRGTPPPNANRPHDGDRGSTRPAPSRSGGEGRRASPPSRRSDPPPRRSAPPPRRPAPPKKEKPRGH
jgi:Family of unknown function (DUF6600)/FecR protein